MKRLLLLIFSGLALYAQAQDSISIQNTQYVKGVVLEETSKGHFNPLVGATVHRMESNKGTFTDTNGVFVLTKESEMWLIVSYIGYKSDTMHVHDVGQLRVILKDEQTKSLQEVTVEGHAATSFLSSLEPLNTRTMSEKELFKAACCNLSESFETNPSVDVNFADAVSGAKQIQMLGLSGIYTQLTNENLPGTRGLASNYGLGYVPGPWVESIQVTKGVGSAANGYESVASGTGMEPNNGNSYLPPSLTLGTNAIALSRNPASDGYHGDNNVYKGTVSGTKASLLTSICTISNWTTSETTAYDLSAGGSNFQGINPVFKVTLLVTSTDNSQYETENTTLEMFPNPNNGIFELKTSEGELGKISIINVVGETVFSTTINSPQSTIQVPELKAGTYFVLSRKQGLPISKRLIIGK